jgi:hypothetical protein
VARRAAELTVREREEPPAPEPVAAPIPVADGSPGRFNLQALERLVAERGSAFPGRVEEWTSYLFFLRDYAGADGQVPAAFDWLIEETFGELLS